MLVLFLQNSLQENASLLLDCKFTLDSTYSTRGFFEIQFDQLFWSYLITIFPVTQITGTAPHVYHQLPCWGWLGAKGSVQRVVREHLNEWLCCVDSLLRASCAVVFLSEAMAPSPLSSLAACLPEVWRSWVFWGSSTLCSNRHWIGTMVWELSLERGSHMPRMNVINTKF